MNIESSVMDHTKRQISKKAFALLKRPVVFLSLVLLMIVAFTPLSFYKERATYMCSECASQRNVYQWVFGLTPEFSVPVSPHWDVLKISRVCKDLCPPNHQHQWVFGQASPYRLGYIWYGCAIGAGRPGYLASEYELSEEFRTYITEQEHQNKLTRTQSLTLLSLPIYPEPNQTN